MKKAPSSSSTARGKAAASVQARLTRARTRLDGIRQAIADTPRRERRDPFFGVQLAAEAQAQAEVKALEKLHGKERL